MKTKLIKNILDNWSTLFDSTQDYVFIVDRNCVIQKANQALANAMDQPLHQLIGQKCFKVFHQSENPWTHCPLAKAKTKKMSNTLEFRMPRTGQAILVTFMPIYNKLDEMIGALHIAMQK